MSEEIQWIFSVSKDAETDSRVMPRNSRNALGPSVFSGEKGTPRLVNADSGKTI